MWKPDADFEQFAVESLKASLHSDLDSCIRLCPAVELFFLRDIIRDAYSSRSLAEALRGALGADGLKMLLDGMTEGKA